jgi:ABC-2 type transport system ATP-binding protein
MIYVQQVSMYYPVPRRFGQWLLHPFTKPKQYCALQGVSLDVATGERLAILGENGAGKTTLLKLIGGLLYPTQGHIMVNGFDTITHNAAARRSVGFVLNEERSFYWRLTGWQNLAFFGALDNLYGQALQEKIESLLRLTGLQDEGHKLVAHYSTGMRQRLAIARGLLADPAILILDEPTRALDPVSANAIKELIIEKLHSGTGRTLLVATHNFEEAAGLCNRVCIMQGGQVITQQSLNGATTALDLKEYYTTLITQKRLVI